MNLSKNVKKHHGVNMFSLLLVAALLTQITALAAAQSSPEISELANLPAGSYPSAVVYGPGQAYWVPQMNANAIRYFQNPPEQYQMDLAAPDSIPYDAVIGPDKAVWFTEKGNASIGRISPSSSGIPITEMVEYPLEDDTADPTQLTMTHDGRLAFTLFAADKIGLMTTNGVQSEIVLPTGTRPLGIVNDQDGNLWYSGWGTRTLGRITPEGELSTIPTGETAFRPTELIRDQDGYLWVLLDNARRILRLDTRAGVISSHTIPAVLSSSFVDIALGVDGKIWLLGNESVGWFDHPLGQPQDFHELELNPRIFEGQGRAQLSAGPENNMIFTHNNDSILRQVMLPSSLLRDLQMIAPKIPPLVLAAGEFYLTMQVVNWSRQDANDAIIQLGLDENVQFVGIDGVDLADCQQADFEVQCNLGSIPAGATRQLFVTYTTSRLPSYAVERQLDFEVALPDGDYQPQNNRQVRPLIIQESIDYFNDFEVSADDGLWSHTILQPSGTASQTLGRFSNDNVSITFPDLPPHDRVHICFELYVMGSWDGNQFRDPDVMVEPVPIIGPDIWANYINDSRLVVASFSNQARFGQSFPANYREGDYAAQQNATALGDFDQDGLLNDARYDFCYTREHTDETFRTTFYGVNLDEDSYETWSLDNVEAKIYYHDLYEWLYLPYLMR